MNAKKRFVKNLIQIICYIACNVILILPVLLGFIFMKPLESDPDYGLSNKFLIIYIGAVVLVSFCIGFYWIFQTVTIDGNGITIQLFRRAIKYCSWDEVQSIKKTNIMRNDCYTFYLKNEKKQLNLDYRKSIKKAILFYAPSSIKEMIVDIGLKPTPS